MSYFVSNAERKAGTGCGGKDITIWTSMTLPERERCRDYSSFDMGPALQCCLLSATGFEGRIQLRSKDLTTITELFSNLL